MPRCEVCENEYDKAFQVLMAGKPPRWFDSFERAIQAMAPQCSQCGCRILGHGVEKEGIFFCGAHCAARGGAEELRDRA